MVQNLQDKRLLKIGDLARESDKTVRALRYYEELGLLEPADHTKGGFRLYHPDEVKRVHLIGQLQELGFSLDKIQEIVAAWRRGRKGEDVAHPLRAFFEGGLGDIRRKIARLRKMEADMLEALRFLTACRSCQDAPARDLCSGCEKGDHHAQLPFLMDALARGK